MQLAAIAGTAERESRLFLLSCLMRFAGFISVLLAALPLRAAAQTPPPPAPPGARFGLCRAPAFQKAPLLGQEGLGTGAASIVGMISSTARGEYDLVGINALVTVVSTMMGLR